MGSDKSIGLDWCERPFLTNSTTPAAAPGLAITFGSPGEWKERGHECCDSNREDKLGPAQCRRQLCGIEGPRGSPSWVGGLERGPERVGLTSLLSCPMVQLSRASLRPWKEARFEVVPRERKPELNGLRGSAEEDGLGEGASWWEKKETRSEFVKDWAGEGWPGQARRESCGGRATASA